jgi:hypothetical protein
MYSFLLKFTFVLNSVLVFWKLLVFEFLLGITETLHCSMSVLHVKIVLLLDVHQQLMLSARMLKYSEPRTFTLIIFCCYYYYYYYYYYYFPAACKEAAIVPVFKTGNHAAVSNYRPISILNNFSKLFEFLMMFCIMLN